MDTGFSKNVASPAEMDWLPPGTHMVWVWVRKSSSTMGLISQKKSWFGAWKLALHNKWSLISLCVRYLHITYTYMYTYIYMCVLHIYIYIYTVYKYIYIYIYAQMRNHLNRFSFVNYVNSATLMANVAWFPLLNIDMQSQQKMQRRRYHQKPWLIKYYLQ